MIIKTIPGLILNSLSCVLSYNYYDYAALLRRTDKAKEGKKEVLHESTLSLRVLEWEQRSCPCTRPSSGQWTLFAFYIVFCIYVQNDITFFANLSW